MTHTTPIPRPMSAAMPKTRMNGSSEGTRRRCVDLALFTHRGSAWRSPPQPRMRSRSGRML